MNSTPAESSPRPAILITGASAGLGAEYARQFNASDSRTLILVARRHERLVALQESLQGKSEVICCDLSSHEQRLELFERVKALGYRVEVLVNNAGFGSLGPFKESALDWELKMIDVNCKAPLHLLHLFLPDLLETGRLSQCRGSVINLCSTAAFQAMPYMATYGATKSFLLQFTNALAAEFGDQLVFLAHCPGPTRTEFHLVVGLPEKLSYIPSASAEKVVGEALKKLHLASSGTLINGRLNFLLSQLNRVFPRSFAARIVARILRNARA